MTLHVPLTLAPNATNPFGKSSSLNLPGELYSDSHGPLWAYFGTTPRQGYTVGRPHQGTDYPGPLGTPVFAMAPSTVISHGFDAQRGIYVLTHWKTQAGGQMVLCEQHLSKITVPTGSTVSAGQQVGAMGCTGQCVGGPNCHVELRMTPSATANPIYWQTWRAVNVLRVVPGGSDAEDPLYLPVDPTILKFPGGKLYRTPVVGTTLTVGYANASAFSGTFASTNFPGTPNPWWKVVTGPAKYLGYYAPRGVLTP